MIVRMPAPVLSLKSNPIKKSLYKLMVFLSARKLATPLALDIRNKKFSVISLESMIVCKFLAVSSNFRKTHRPPVRCLNGN